jgi:FAD synthetase
LKLCNGDLLTRVLATGTFDLLHPGHLHYLSEARKLGDELYVIVARESMIKHKPKPVIPENQRVTMVNALNVVDKAVLGSEINIYEPIKNIKPDIITIGYDQKFSSNSIEKNLEELGINAKVVRINKLSDCSLCSSGKIIDRILGRYC